MALKTVYIKLEVDANSYQTAEAKVENIFLNIENIIPPEAIGILPIIKSRQFVNKVKM